jgi:hypothetical protein
MTDVPAIRGALYLEVLAFRLWEKRQFLHPHYDQRCRAAAVKTEARSLTSLVLDLKIDLFADSIHLYLCRQLSPQINEADAGIHVCSMVAGNCHRARSGAFRRLLG